MNHPLIDQFLRDKRVIGARERALLEEAQEVLRSAEEQAGQLIRDASQQAAAMLDQAARKIERDKQQAVEKAESTAREAAARTLAAQSSTRARSVVSMEERIGVLVTRTLGKVLNESEVDKQFFAGVMRRVLSAVREEKFLSVRVCPEQLNVARKSIDSMIRQVGATQFVEVKGDPKLQRGCCLVESEYGVIDASLETQLDAIRQALTKVWSQPDV